MKVLSIVCALASVASLPARASTTAAFHFYALEGSNLISTQVRYPAEQIDVRVAGLAPNALYTLKTTLNYGTSLFGSSIEVNADRAGVIDTLTSHPVSGSYTGADPDGIFWSMVETGTAPPATPRYHFQLERNGASVQSGDLPLVSLRPGVKVVSLEGTGLVGQLFLPSGTGPHPAIIAFGGSEGGTATGETDAEVLANAGYVGLGLGYFGADGLPAKLADIPLEYFARAIQFLQSRSDVRSDRIGVMGVSRGGELALLLGATFPQIKAVVAQVPSPIRWAGNDYESGHWPPAWTYHGDALPYLAPNAWLTPVTLPDGRTAYDNRPVFEKGMKDTQGVAAAMSAIEKTHGPIFMVGGEDDEMWPSCDLIDLAMKRLQANHHPFPDEAICYPGAGHTVGLVPVGSTMETVIDEGGNLMNLGGDPAKIAFGQRDSWTKTLQFLRSALN